MGYEQRITRWLFIILIGIIIHFWGGYIHTGLKNTGRILFFSIDRIGVLNDRAVSEFRKSFKIFKIIWKHPRALVLKVILSIIYFFTIIIPFFIFLSIFLVFFHLVGLILALLYLFFLLGSWIINGLMKIRAFNLAAYTLSLFVLSYILGKFSCFIIFSWLYQTDQREREKEKGLKKMGDEPLAEIDRLNTALIEMIKENPVLLRYLPADTFEYKGLFQEILKRFRIKQAEKTAKATIDQIREVKKIWEELASLYKTIGGIAIERKRNRAQFKRIDLEEEVICLELEKKKAELIKSIAEIIAESQSIKKISPEEVFIEKTKKQIRELKTKGVGMKMFLEARDEVLSDPELQKHPEIFQKVKNMWDDYIWRS